jgi:hypothetical protein
LFGYLFTSKTNTQKSQHSKNYINQHPYFG